MKKIKNLLWIINFKMCYWRLNRLKLNVSREKIINIFAQHGLKDKNGCPKKCMCGCIDFKRVDDLYDGIYPGEFGLICKNCNLVVGYWCNDQWDI